MKNEQEGIDIMEDLSLHILDVAENSIAGGASLIKIKIVEDTEKDLLTIEIIDNGKGMDEETVRKATDPFFTTRTTRRVGLGLSLLAEAVRIADGDFTIDSKPGRGTKVKACFKYSHIDRKPLGSIGETLMSLLVGNPAIDFKFCHRKDLREYRMDTAELKSHSGIKLMEPTLAFKIMDGYAKFIKEE